MPSYNTLYQRANYERKRARAIEFLGGECIKCGSIDKLQFDHMNPLVKNYNATALFRYSWSRIVAELQLCQLLCYECHAEKTLREKFKYEPPLRKT